MPGPARAGHRKQAKQRASGGNIRGSGDTELTLHHWGVVPDHLSASKAFQAEIRALPGEVEAFQHYMSYFQTVCHQSDFLTPSSSHSCSRLNIGGTHAKILGSEIMVRVKEAGG